MTDTGGDIATRESSRIRIVGTDGKPVLTLKGPTESSRTAADGSVQVQSTQDRVETVDGQIANPGDKLAICHFCRQGERGWFRRRIRNHGLVTPGNAVNCSRCGRSTCPLHRREQLCVDCAQPRWWRQLLTLVFFTRE